LILPSPLFERFYYGNQANSTFPPVNLAEYDDSEDEMLRQAMALSMAEANPNQTASTEVKKADSEPASKPSSSRKLINSKDELFFERDVEPTKQELNNLLENVQNEIKNMGSIGENLQLEEDNRLIVDQIHVQTQGSGTFIKKGDSERAMMEQHDKVKDKSRGETEYKTDNKKEQQPEDNFAQFQKTSKDIQGTLDRLEANTVAPTTKSSLGLNSNTPQKSKRNGTPPPLEPIPHHSSSISSTIGGQTGQNKKSSGGGSAQNEALNKKTGDKIKLFNPVLNPVFPYGREFLRLQQLILQVEADLRNNNGMVPIVSGGNNEGSNNPNDKENGKPQKSDTIKPQKADDHVADPLAPRKELLELLGVF
jgi:hypothetical protein